MSDIEYSVIKSDVIKSFDCTRWYKLLPFEGPLMRNMMNSVLICINHITEKKTDRSMGDLEEDT